LFLKLQKFGDELDPLGERGCKKEQLEAQIPKQTADSELRLHCSPRR
jgi:hypothetical protein